MTIDEHKLAFELKSRVEKLVERLDTDAANPATVSTIVVLYGVLADMRRLLGESL